MHSISETEEKFMGIVRRLKAEGRTLSAMESCTGGLIASLMTDISGASEVFPGGFVTYSNRAKIKQGVKDSLIGTFGVYSPETAEFMAKAAASGMDTDLGVGITGSLGRKDPANPDSIPGVAYAAVYDAKTGETVQGKLTLEPQEDTPENRRQAKLSMADLAADLILKTLE